MPISSSLSGSHLRTHEKIFQHPLTHNLTWREVRALFAHLGQVVEEANGHLTVTLHGQTIVLHPSISKDVSDVDEVMKIRHFLARAEAAPPAATAQPGDMLVVINHHEARLYRTEMRGAVPERFSPQRPEDSFRHAPHAPDFTRGKEKPDPISFFTPIALALKEANRFLVFGSGKGKSSEMEQFIAWLEERHPELARRIAGSSVIDEHHLSDGELLAKARAVYAAL